MSAPSACAPFGVYVHWPFCTRICPYCDFNVRRDRGVEPERWTAALIRDLEDRARSAPGRRVSSLYFGGGTPSLAPPSLIERVIAATERLWGFVDRTEITLEANPTDAARFADFRAAGVNRLSLGVQSFDDSALAFLGRAHDSAAARRALQEALSQFARVSADLIYALPDQSVRQWRAQLSVAVDAGLRHLSCYQLTIEDGTPFARAAAKGRWRPADEARCADLFEATADALAAAGLPAYEISNHAAPGEESRHNLLYWRGGDYVGVGPGAHGRLTVGGVRRAVETVRDPARYLDQVARLGSGVVVNDPLSDEQVLTERLAMGLRLSEGIALSAADWARIAERAAALEAEGALERRGSRLTATPAGRRMLDALLMRLV
jgi:oxygen-independent coproporphyrinogen-3 oxidase